MTTSSAATPLRAYYDVLSELKEYEQTKLAEAHAEDPELLLRRFGQSVSDFAAPIAEPFYGGERANPALYRVPSSDISSTIEFAAHICDGGALLVASRPPLGFRYVDREISSLRTAATNRAARRSLDLLLTNAEDGLPIFAELKIGSDKPSYFALVQLLALAADLLPEPQRARLQRHGASAGLRSPGSGPFADLYIITFKPPKTGKYRQRSFEATREISKKLMDEKAFASQIRRIAYLEAVPKDHELEFHARFAFGAGL